MIHYPSFYLSKPHIKTREKILERPRFCIISSKYRVLSVKLNI